MNGHIWELTSSENKKWGLETQSKDIDEALQKFRDLWGYTHTLIDITYITKVGEIID